MQYLIHNSGNYLELSKKSDNRTIVSGVWWITWSKYKSEILDNNDNLIYTISRKFSFWKWKMSFIVKSPSGEIFLVEGKNKSHTIYQSVIKENIFEIKIHKKRKKSVFKNGVQIASIDESFVSVFGESKGHIMTNSPENIIEIFTLFFCLNFGEKNDNSLEFNFGNIGKAEPIDENWKP